MAAATIVSTPYGYRAHTGTDADSVVTTTKVRLLGVHFYGSAGNETVKVTDTAGTILAFITLTAADTKYVPFWGVPVDGLLVDLSAGTAEVHFLVA